MAPGCVLCVSQYAIQLANASADKVVDILDSIILAEKINLDQTGNVFIAKDTRQSSEVRNPPPSDCLQ